MLIGTRSIPEGHSTLAGPANLDVDRADFEVVGQVPCVVDVDRRGSRIHLHIRYTGSIRLACSRCLELFTFAEHGELRLILDQGESSKEDDLVDFWYTDEEPDIDIGPAILDEILMTVPMKPLCSQECQGVLASTGLDNDTSTSQGSVTIDPRWEALKKLKYRPRD